MTLNIVTCIYLIALVFAVLNIVLLIESGIRPDIYTVLLMSAVVVANGGYLTVAVSKTVDAAVIGNSLIYLGGCYLPFFVFSIGANLTGINVPHRVNIFLVSVSTFVIGCTFTVGRSALYYRSVAIEDAGGFTVMVKEYGPLHYSYYAMLVMYLIAVAHITGFAIKRRNIVSYKTTILYSVFLFTNVLIYFIDRTLNIHFEWNAIAYLITELTILVIYKRVSMYDMSYNIMSAWEKREEYAYIVFDKNKNYLGSNALARQYFENLNYQQIDRKLSGNLPEITDLLKRFDRMNAGNEDDTKASYKETLKLSGRVLKSEVKFLSRKRALDFLGNTVYGYLIEFNDVTKDSEYIASIEEKNEKLAAAEKRALEASNAKSDFLSAMSHEIRTPINTILGMNEMISREAKDLVVLGYSRDVEKAGHLLLNLINDVLDFSKIEAGNFEFDEKEYSIQELADTAGIMLEKRAFDKNLRIALAVDPGMPSGLIGDAGKIEQILLNLVTNAVKYTNEGYIRISVSGDYTDEGFDLEVSVSDTGMGIRPENLDHIFDSFTRVDLKKNRNIEGTGLGLAITKKLCEGMGGTIKVSSRYGEGSVFTVKIPQKIGDSTLIGSVKFNKTTQKVKRKRYEASFTAPSARVLIVDDNEMNVAVFVSLLKDTKVRIDSAYGGDQALELSLKNKYDVIFMDHMMPSPDGIETLHKIRENENNPNRDTPEIALTANAVSGSMEMYLKAGFNGYLSKPVDPLELEEAVMKNISPELVLPNIT